MVARVYVARNRMTKSLRTKSADSAKNMRAAPDPVGPENDRTIVDSCLWADQIIAGWGNHGAHLNRGPAVDNLLQDSGMAIYHLGLTKAGHPKHPLYIAYGQSPERWLRG